MMKPSCTIFQIPRGPSVNAAYKNVAGKGRAKTERFTTWANAAGWEIRAQKPEPITGPVEISLILAAPRNKDGTISRKRIDASNFIKATEDLCVTHGLIEDDNLTCVYRVSAEWDFSGDVPAGMCRVIIYPVTERRIA